MRSLVVFIEIIIPRSSFKCKLLPPLLSKLIFRHAIDGVGKVKINASMGVQAFQAAHISFYVVYVLPHGKVERPIASMIDI